MTRVRAHARPHQIDVSGVLTCITISFSKGKLSKVNCLSSLSIGCCRFRIYLLCRWLNPALIRRELLCAAVRCHTSNSLHRFAIVICIPLILYLVGVSVSIACVFITAAIYRPPSKVMVSKLPHAMSGGPTTRTTSSALKQTWLPPIFPSTAFLTPFRITHIIHL